ncbi:MAG: 4a-hydroxytetrahydrobiopterin dehydratase [Pseudomonadales bacterium]|nr:4a-hydroxytetrahydrobiopterin dehydratase [Pseudomonadales bacterium]
MTEDLCSLRCEACRADAPLVTAEEKQAYLPQIPQWSVIERDGIEQLFRCFSFKTYADAVAFTHQLACLAEQHDHHPAILLEWGKVEVRWWSHKIRGLHKNDFILAALTDGLPKSNSDNSLT